MKEASDTTAPFQADDLPPVDLDQLLAEAEAISQEIVEGRSAESEADSTDLEPEGLDAALEMAAPETEDGGAGDQVTDFDETVSEEDEPTLILEVEPTVAAPITPSAESSDSGEVEALADAVSTVEPRPEHTQANSIPSGSNPDDDASMDALIAAAVATRPTSTAPETDPISSKPAVSIANEIAGATPEAAKANASAEVVAAPPAGAIETPADEDSVNPQESLSATETLDVSAEEMAAALPEMDPVEAVDRVQADAEELSDLLNDPDAGKREAAAVEETVQSESPVTGDTVSMDAPASGAAVAANSSIATEKPEPAPASKSKRDSESATDGESARTDAPVVEKDDRPAPTEEDAPAQARRSFIQRALGVTMALIRGVKSAVTYTLNGGFKVLELIDIPFQRISPSVKWVVGLVGLVTLCMGIAAWFLPGMLTSNPFESMDSGIATQ